MMGKNYTLTKSDCGKLITTEESRQIELDMLDTLAKFCDEHGLRYFLSGGTLLGAIRHKGFIPWDDDIDVNMPRPDCEKLLKLTRGKLGKYRLTGPDNGTYMDYSNWFRIYDDDTVIEDYKGGITSKNPFYHPMFIDVFPIEGLPSNILKCYFHWGYLFFLINMRRASALSHMEAKSIWRHIVHLLIVGPAKIIGYKNWGDAIQKSSRKYSFDCSSYVGVTTTALYLTHERVYKKDYLKTIKVTFEGKEYNAPGDYDTYLKQLYGDEYIQMPPKEKQKSHHAFKEYWRVQK